MQIKHKINIFHILTVLALITAVVSALTVTSIYAKYSDSIDNDYSLSAHSFYFSSDILLPEGGNETFTTAFDIEIYNFIGEQESSYNITYTVSVTDIQTTGNDTVLINDSGDGVLLGGTADTATITVTPHEDVAAFTIQVSTSNGYAKSLSMRFEKE